MLLPEEPQRLGVFSSLDADALGGFAQFHGKTLMASSTWPTANKALILPFSVRRFYKFSTFWWANGTAVNGAVDVAVCTLKGAKLLSTGAVTQAGTSVIQSAAPGAGPPWCLHPGAYYLVFSPSSATATFITKNAGGITPREGAMAGLAEQTTAHPVPATITPVTLSFSPVPIPLFGLSDAPTI